jgi:hypothetical protein
VNDLPAARWIGWAWALLAVTSALYFLSNHEADNDLWMHVFTGRLILATASVPQADTWSYTASGQPWVDHEWLTQAAFAALFERFGSGGLWVAKLAIGAAALWLVWRLITRCSAVAWVRGVTLVITAAAVGRGYAVRPQIVTYLGVAALLTLLDRLARAGQRPPATALVVGIVIAFALWANAHGGFLVGIAMLALFAIGPGADRGAATIGAGLRIAMLIAAVVGACLTPYGPALFAYLRHELVTPHPITEWQPLQLAAEHLPALAMLLALTVTAPWTRLLRRRPWWALVLAGTAALALRQQRQAPIFALCAAAPLADQVDALRVWAAARTPHRLSAAAIRIVAVGVVGVSLVQLAGVALQLRRSGLGLEYLADEYPVGAFAFLRQRGIHGNLAVPLDWGGYALWYGSPALKVSLDGRFATVYPARVVDDSFAFFGGATGDAGTALLERYDTTLVLAPRDHHLAVERRSDWHALYRDEVAELFARSAAAEPVTTDAPRGWRAFP